MEEDKKTKDGEGEEKKTEENKSQKTNENSDAGISSEEKTIIEKAKEEREKLEKSRADLKAENDRTERLIAEREFGGRAGMSANQKPREISDIEYAENLQKGISNPLKEDGFIK